MRDFSDIRECHYAASPLISTVNGMRYIMLKPGQSRARFEDPSAILNAGTWSHLGGKFKR